MSEKTGPITNSVRNRAMPVITWFGGDCCSPRALRTSDSTTTILVNEVHSRSTEGATDSTVIARIKVIDVLGLPPPTEMSTPPSPAGAAGLVGAAGAVERPGRRGGGDGGARGPLAVVLGRRDGDRPGRLPRVHRGVHRLGVDL